MKQQDREQQQLSAKAILHEERQARGAARSPGKARGDVHRTTATLTPAGAGEPASGKRTPRGVATFGGDPQPQSRGTGQDPARRLHTR